MTLKEIYKKRKFLKKRGTYDMAIKYRRMELDEFKERRREGLCCAIIHHGPGHQSKTFCELKGKHREHYAIYGIYDLEAYWSGMHGSSGSADQC